MEDTKNVTRNRGGIVCEEARTLLNDRLLSLYEEEPTYSPHQSTPRSFSNEYKYDKMGVSPKTAANILNGKTCDKNLCISVFKRLQLQWHDAYWRLIPSNAEGSSPISLPLRSPLPRPLPVPIGELIGRKGEIEGVRELLSGKRLITLTGMGGIGKTRLAIAVAEKVADGFPDGVWFVDLSALSDPAQAAETVGMALGFKENSIQTSPQTLARLIGNRTVLMVLDNCEQVLDACADLSRALLAGCPHLNILATSRQRLDISGEQAYPVLSLSLPAQPVGADMRELSQSEATRLFLTRVQEIQPHLAFTSTHAPHVAEICTRLEGIPLALELAAVWVNSLSFEEISNRLGKRLGPLTGGRRTGPARHQTLRAAIDGSYDLLDAPQKRMLRQLSVFAGEWTLEAARRVCRRERGAGGGFLEEGEMEEGEALALLNALVDRSLVMADIQGKPPRYRLLETIREYGLEKLQESGENDTARTRHRDYFSTLAMEAGPKVMGAEQAVWLRKLTTDHENLRAALEWSLKNGEAEESLRLCGALQAFWGMQGYLSEGLDWCENALKVGAQAQTSQRARVLNAAGNLALCQSKYDIARTYHTECLAIRRAAKERGGIADSLANLGLINYEQGKYDEAQTEFDESLSLREEENDEWNSAYSRYNLALVAHDRGRHEEAQRYSEASLSVFEERNDQEGIAYVNMTFGFVAVAQGRCEDADTYFGASLNFFQSISEQRGIAGSSHGLGLVASAQGNYVEARFHLAGSLAIQDKIHAPNGIAASLQAFANLAALEGQRKQAVELWGAAKALRDRIGAPLPPCWQEEYARAVAAVRAVMGEATFQIAWRYGQTMPLKQAIAQAMQQTDV